MVVIFLKVIEINSLVLAYLGDTIYENYVRKFLIRRGIAHVDELQKEAVKYVSAKSQAAYLKKMINVNFLSDEEMDIVTYKYATGLEALIGYLDLDNKRDRIDMIMKFILEDSVC